MTVVYSAFAAKYIVQFPALSQTTYNLWYPDVVTEIGRTAWGTLTNAATEALLGYKLALAQLSPSSVGAVILEVSKADGEYREGRDTTAKWANWFLAEYQRLLDMISTPVVATSTSGQIRSGNRSTEIKF